jgi:hypothetical protein
VSCLYVDVCLNRCLSPVGISGLTGSFHPPRFGRPRTRYRDFGAQGRSALSALSARPVRIGPGWPWGSEGDPASWHDYSSTRELRFCIERGLTSSSSRSCGTRVPGFVWWVLGRPSGVRSPRPHPWSSGRSEQMPRGCGLTREGADGEGAGPLERYRILLLRAQIAKGTCRLVVSGRPPGLSRHTSGGDR